jgi:hypothetical protein
MNHDAPHDSGKSFLVRFDDELATQFEDWRRSQIQIPSAGLTNCIGPKMIRLANIKAE